MEKVLKMKVTSELMHSKCVHSVLNKNPVRWASRVAGFKKKAGTSPWQPGYSGCLPESRDRTQFHLAHAVT